MTSAEGERQEIDCPHLATGKLPRAQEAGRQANWAAHAEGRRASPLSSDFSRLPRLSLPGERQETASGPGKTLTWEAGDFVLVMVSQLPAA